MGWFENYLINRTQRVKFNAILSESISVNVGVPQGSVLGPLLFLMYINDITESINENCSISLFADDAVIYTTGYSSQEVNDKLNEQIIKIEEWMRKNKLEVNVGKTKIMLIRSVRKSIVEENVKIEMQNKTLEVVEEIKYLGIIIDKNLSFTAHIDYVSKKIGGKLGVLRRIGKDMTAYMKCTVYKSIIAPIFEYCMSLMLSVSKTNLQYLQKLRNRAMRIILRCNRRVRIKDMLEALHFMSIKERIHFNVCLLVHKMVNGLCLNYFTEKVHIIRSESAVQTRQKDNLYIEKCNTSGVQKTILHEGFAMYNELPSKIKNEQRLKFQE